jgi:hypothetical protein
LHNPKPAGFCSLVSGEFHASAEAANVMGALGAMAVLRTAPSSATRGTTCSCAAFVAGIGCSASMATALWFPRTDGARLPQMPDPPLPERLMSRRGT